MFFCLRVDLDYVPWDTPDASDFGHGEPAALLRLLELARGRGYKLHFFASNRVLRAFPAGAETVLNEGHDLDWLCKHPEAAHARLGESKELFRELGHSAVGFAIRSPWTPDWPSDWVTEFRFCCGPPGPEPAGLHYVAVETRFDREAARSGINARRWADGLRSHVRDAASRNLSVTLGVRPQVLAKIDRNLSHLAEVLDLCQAIGLQNRTLRDAPTP
jgi:hypothetical protein